MCRDVTISHLVWEDGMIGHPILRVDRVLIFCLTKYVQYFENYLNFSKLIIFMAEALQMLYILFSLWGVVMLGALINALIKLQQNKGTIRDFHHRAAILSSVLLLTTIISLSLLSFGYTLPGSVFFFVVFLLAIVYSSVTIKSTIKAYREINAKMIKESGIRTLKWTDIFTHSGWIQLTLRFGLSRAGIIIFIVNFIMLLVLFQVLNQFILDGTLVDALRDALFLAVITTGFFIYSIKKK